jgi:hypothetical protein
VSLALQRLHFLYQLPVHLQQVLVLQSMPLALQQDAVVFLLQLLPELLLPEFCLSNASISLVGLAAQAFL